MCGPHGQVACNHIEEGNHATYSQAKYKYTTHVHIQAMTIKMNNDKDSMLKDYQDDIQARELTHQVKWYTTVSLCMWSEQNNHGKIKVTMLRQAR